MFYWIYDYSSLTIGILFALAFASVMWLAIFVTRIKFHEWFHREERSNQMLGFAFSSFFVLYGLLLGLLSVAAYQNYANVGDLVTKEASSLGSLYRNVRGYPNPMRDNLHSQLKDYTTYVIEKGWPLTRKGIVDNEGTHLLTQLMDEMMSFKPEDKGQESVHAEALRHVSVLVEIRSIRVDNTSTGLPREMWWVVVLGALISILMVALLDMKIHVHVILGTALSVFLGAVIFVIAVMDNPFRGELSIGPDAFQKVYDSLMKPNDDLVNAMTTMMKMGEKLGIPKSQGFHPVAERNVRGLYFGDALMNNSFETVDQLVEQHDGTATFFVKDGEDFVRIATTIRKEDGERAIGTILDPDGPAIAAIRSGVAYYGAATILEKPYITAYEPIRDVSGVIIGIYYVGFRLPDSPAPLQTSGPN